MRFRATGFSDQVSNAQHVTEGIRHRVMLHGHEDGVEDNADGDSQVDKWIHDDDIQPLFDPPPAATAVPLQEEVGKTVPTWRTRPLVLLVLWDRHKDWLVT